MSGFKPEKLLTKNLGFFIPYMLFLIIGAYFVISYPKSDIHLYINQFYSPFFDFFFTYWTFLGNGIFNAFVFVILLFISLRYALSVGAASVTTGVVIQILKRVVFDGTYRPLRYFEDTPHTLHIVEGVDMSMYFSLPSGHTAGAFALFLCLSLFLTKKHWILKLMAFLIAVSVGFSRIYLSQHFLIDVIYGSLAGSVIAIVFYLIFNNLSHPLLDHSIQKVLSERKKS